MCRFKLPHFCVRVSFASIKKKNCVHTMGCCGRVILYCESLLSSSSPVQNLCIWYHSNAWNDDVNRAFYLYMHLPCKRHFCAKVWSVTSINGRWFFCGCKNRVLEESLRIISIVSWLSSCCCCVSVVIRLFLLLLLYSWALGSKLSEDVLLPINLRMKDGTYSLHELLPYSLSSFNEPITPHEVITAPIHFSNILM